MFPPMTGPVLPDEIHPLGVLLKEIDKAKTLSNVQKAVDKYVNYRAKYHKEKVGKGGPISTFFLEFKNMIYFTWAFDVNFVCCRCNKEIKRSIIYC